MVFGVEDAFAEDLLTRYGWQARVAVPGEPDVNYGRYPFPVMPRNVPGIPRVYLMSATRS